MITQDDRDALGMVLGGYQNIEDFRRCDPLNNDIAGRLADRVVAAGWVPPTTIGDLTRIKVRAEATGCVVATHDRGKAGTPSYQAWEVAFPEGGTPTLAGIIAALTESVFPAAAPAGGQARP